MKSLRILTAGLLLVASWDAWGQVIEVKGVRIWPAPDNTRLVFETTGQVDHRLFSLKDPDRLVIDLKNARLAKADGLSASGAILGGIRTAPHEGDLRIVLDLKQKVQPKSFTLPAAQGYSDRLVIDLFPEGVDEVAALAAAAGRTAGAGEKANPAKEPVPAKEPANEAVAVAVAPAKDAPKEPVAAKEPSKEPVKELQVAVEVKEPAREPAKEPAEKERKGTERMPAARAVGSTKSAKTPAVRGRDLVIAIDAGHGGEDPGAVGPRGTYEKDVVLAIARRLKGLVDSEPGMRPIMIRDGDYFVSLGQRVRKARAAKADLFISIHADAFMNRAARGASVYMLSDRGATSEQARMLAQRENESDSVGGVSLDDKDDLLASVLLDLSQTATKEASTDVAQRVLSSLGDVGQLHRSQVERAGFKVLKAPDIPSILVESAFISNSEEERLLKTPSYQGSLAQAIVQGLRTHFRRYAPPGTLVAQQAMEGGGRLLPVSATPTQREAPARSAHQVAENDEALSDRREFFGGFAR